MADVCSADPESVRSVIELTFRQLVRVIRTDISAMKVNTAHMLVGLAFLPTLKPQPAWVGARLDVPLPIIPAGTDSASPTPCITYEPVVKASLARSQSFFFSTSRLHAIFDFFDIYVETRSN